jgi:hypothetical protein
LVVDESPSWYVGFYPSEEDFLISPALHSFEGHRVAVVGRIERGRTPGPISLFGKILAEWNLGSQEAARLLGFEDNETKLAEDVLSGITTLRGKDAKERLRNILRIKVKLDALFENPEAQNKWLHRPAPLLEGKVPFDLLLDGSFENILRVRELVDHITGA